ncbi:MAG: A/G-specific adenine glycosylase [Clostridia bacterium]|nr:A/G-specific adenine glycosylase [Clostridia bacterium]
MPAPSFPVALLAWYDTGHRALPWRDTRDPYAIWVSEVMLQQTRAETVIGYYQRFLQRFPTVHALANAPEQELLKSWEGLGYYSRARNLQKAAKRIVSEHGGALPSDAHALGLLPGIGPYTSRAIASIAFGQQVAAVDGNVERVIARVAGIREEVTVPSVGRAIRTYADGLVPMDRPGDFNNAMMELGARVCVPGTPDCEACPVHAWCDAHHEGDADALPVKRRIRTPVVEKRGVAIIRCGRQVLVQRRTERMLHGMWQFPNALDAWEPDVLLRGLGLSAEWAGDAGEAKHVFTHRVWEMRLHRFITQTPIQMPECRWVDAAGLDELPFPTAMGAAKKAAIEWLEEVM